MTNFHFSLANNFQAKSPNYEPVFRKKGGKEIKKQADTRKIFTNLLLGIFC